MENFKFSSNFSPFFALFILVVYLEETGENIDRITHINSVSRNLHSVNQFFFFFFTTHFFLTVYHSNSRDMVYNILVPGTMFAISIAN